MQAKKQQLELDMDQQTGSKLRKMNIKAVYCHPAYLTYTQSILKKDMIPMSHQIKTIK